MESPYFLDLSPTHFHFLRDRLFGVLGSFLFEAGRAFLIALDLAQ
jgi:hypothetical protein